MAGNDQDYSYCLEVFKKLNRRKTRWILYKMDEFSIVVDEVSERSATIKDMIKALPDTEPRYAVYDYEFVTDDGRTTSKMYWMYWTPLNSNQEKKVIYTQALSSFRNQFTGTVNIDFSVPKDIEDQFKGECIDGKFTFPQDEPEESDEDFD